MPTPFRVQRRIEFADTDAAGIVHFSVYFRLMEQAEHEFLRSHGLSVIIHDDAGTMSFPRVRAACDYRAALRFEDVVDIDVDVAKIGNTSIAYRFSFSRNGESIATGEIVAVCCQVFRDKPPMPMPIPPEIVAKLRP